MGDIENSKIRLANYLLNNSVGLKLQNKWAKFINATIIFSKISKTHRYNDSEKIWLNSGKEKKININYL